MLPMVPREIGPLARMAEPPVNERRWMTPTNWRSSTVNSARSLFGTQMRGGRPRFRELFGFTGT